MDYKSFLAHQKEIQAKLSSLTPHANQYQESRPETKEAQRRGRISKSLRAKKVEMAKNIKK